MKAMIVLVCCLWAGAAMAQKATIVTDPAEVMRLTGELQRTLHELSPTANIQKCDPVVTEYPQFVGHDEIYGAFCSVSVARNNFRLLMCDDRMVSKFTSSLIDNLSPTLPAEDVIKFVKKNCPPSG